MRVLDLDWNGLYQVGFFQAENLIYLHLNHNYFDRIPQTSPSVEYLNLNNNQIDLDPDKILLTYRKLKRIDMINNQLEFLPEMPSNIMYATFEWNRIKFIDFTVLRNCPKLKGLDLSYNNIYKIHLPEAYYLSKLEILRIQGNNVVFDNAVEKWCKKENFTNSLCSQEKSLKNVE